MIKPATRKPAKGLQGLRENWKKDLLSGFLVSLIALPLSLGIAGASNFPPMMGIVTAIVGGIAVSFLTNSQLAIKGPAIGLIAVVSGAVYEFGQGDIRLGWHLTLGAIIVAGALQILIGWLKLPRFSDFLPLSAVHGVLAAIGIIIMSQQIHLAVGVAPAALEGKQPLELIAMIPHSIMHMEYHIAIIGLVGLMIMFGWRFLSFSFLKKVPPALAVLIVSIALGQFFHLFEPTYSNFKPLINPGDFSLGFRASFAGIGAGQLPVFAKYVLVFALLGTLESMLTVKAIDLMDPFRRKSDASRDVMALGAGNMVAGMLGGLPMISEVARSSANIYNGARTRWSNLFHGLFLLAFVMLLAPVVKMVPVAALASMLIFVGFRLASPAEFWDVYHIGKEQLVIFLVTIVATLTSNILLGIICGILTKVVIQLIYGVNPSHIFDPRVTVTSDREMVFVNVPRAAVFANYMNLKSRLEAIPAGRMVQVDFSKSPYVDHTVMENITRFKNDYDLAGGHMEIIGFEHHLALSDHPLAARKLQRETVLS